MTTGQRPQNSLDGTTGDRSAEFAGKCSHCPARFLTWAELQEHERECPHAPTETCELCSQWASRTPAQLVTRKHNIEKHPLIQVYECPRCGSRAWANTDKFIGAAGGIDLGTKPRMKPSTLYLSGAVILLAGLVLILVLR